MKKAEDKKSKVDVTRSETYTFYSVLPVLVHGRSDCSAAVCTEICDTFLSLSYIIGTV